MLASYDFLLVVGRFRILDKSVTMYTICECRNNVSNGRLWIIADNTVMLIYKCDNLNSLMIAKIGVPETYSIIEHDCTSPIPRMHIEVAEHLVRPNGYMVDIVPDTYRLANQYCISTVHSIYKTGVQIVDL